MTFQFLSANELGLFHLAALLKRHGYRVRIEPTDIARRRSCQATGWIFVKEAELNQLCLEMISLADRFRVIFDRWDLETERFCL
ncbi:MAG: hypothetical protein ACQER4_00150 [Bacteroidota bacterium]